ncbi:MAG: hypothetical protein NTNFB02_10410 [Nitrospira sp.]
MTLGEAAAFLRLSRSSLYQRKDIPRYRRPGSRVILFDQDELEAWLQQGRIDASTGRGESPSSGQDEHHEVPKACISPVDISPSRVYHRSARYR